MADSTASEQPVAQKNSNRDAGRRGRETIARVVVVASFCTIFLMVTVLIVLARGNAGSAASGAAEKAFNAILPVIAGWVGTVLAFYFSSASQDHTNEIFDKAIERAAPRPGDGVAVSAKMLPLAKVLHLHDLKDKSASETLLSDLRREFETKVDGITVTRLLFLERGVFKYVVHVGALNAFLVNIPDAQRGALSLAELVKDETILNQVSKLVVFVSAMTTLADAKVAIEKLTGAQDIIVTPTGNPSEPVLGWLTNADLSKALTAS